MTVHSYHPDTHAYGLSDNCERCAEHAEHPERSLDTDNLVSLRWRIASGAAPRSNNERIAMENLARYDARDDDDEIASWYS
jgi:hypothetical protein